MGKNGWLIAVKRAFRSPTKDSDKKTHTKTHHTDLDQQDDNKKREKKRWRLFRKPTAATEVAHAPMMSNLEAPTLSETRHAVAEVGQPPPTCSREYYAAIVIQTAFRGYLARRALRALKALVKLQALVRGNNVRKHAKMTLQCMQALVRVQARVLEQRMKQCDQSSRKSTLSDANNHWGHRYQHDISERRSMLRDGSSIADDWDEQPHTIEEVKAMLQSRIARQEKTLSPPFSQETRRNGRNPSTGNDGELGLGDRHQWLDRWMGSKPWETRASIDQRDIGVKTVEVDTSQPYSYLPPTNHLRRSSYPQRAPATPSPSKTRPMQVRSASPHYIRERSHHSNQSQRPSLKSNFSFNSVVHQHPRGSPMPNYMAATESAKARVRSQNVPRGIPWTPERDRSGLARKRLSFPVSDAHSGNAYKQQSLRSPSFLSINGVSNYSESIAGGEVSPCSTTDLRRWVQ